MWQLKEVDGLAVVNLGKPFWVLFAGPNCPAVGTTSKMAKYIHFQGLN